MKVKQFSQSITSYLTGLRTMFSLQMLQGNEQESSFLQNTAVIGKQYEWQLLSGIQWLRIDNDHVIESHYCQPGAKGITINTNLGQVFIDFDTLQTNNPALRVQRLSFLPQGLTEDMGWYYKDDSLWREYGAQNSGMVTSSISSKDIEHHFSQNAQGALQFTVGSAGYSLDFSTMTQRNLTTGLCRNVRRRPKFTANSAGLRSPFVVPLSSSSQLPGQTFKWEFMGDEGQWFEYQAYACSLDSAAIERQYQLNQQGQLNFRINRFSYTLDFASMSQINNEIGTTRAVRRTPDSGLQISISSSPRWQFQDMDGLWKDYSKAYGLCSVSSSDIELQYQQNPTGTMMFTTSQLFTYELNFSSWTQRNLSTNTTRSVRRLAQ